MDFRLGNDIINDVKLGESQVEKIMLGNDLIWQKFQPNLILGGVAATINTPLLLSECFSIETSFIKQVKVVGSDVYAEVNPPYNYYLKNHATFNNNPNLTFIKTTDLKFNNIAGSISSCLNLLYVDALGVTSCSNFVLRSCPLLDPEKIKLPLLTNHGFNFLEQSALWGMGKTLNFPNLLPLSNDNNCFKNFRGTINLPKFVSIPNFNLNNIFGTINIVNCTSLGSPSVNNNVFAGCDSRTIINIHYSMATVNSGGPDADLVYATGRGATVNYI